MEISKECPCLNQYYYETWNSYLNVYLLKIVVLLSNHENHLQTIFFYQGKLHTCHLISQVNISYTSLFIAIAKSTLFNFCFFSRQIKFFSILHKRSIVLLSLVISKRCITLETAKHLKTVILPSKVNCLMHHNFIMLSI